jgi:hypothetical protein
MVLNVTADKMVMIDGKIVTIKAGKLETTDKALSDVLLKCNGISQEQEKPIKKSAK